MSTTESQVLLRDYAENGSETAFRELVSRYINLVYSVAIRRVSGDAHSAEDIAQIVFTDFARKGRALPSDTLLGGWLHRHTCFVASTVMRTETRRLTREKLAAEMNTLHQSPEAETETDWKELAPVLDEAVDQLEQSDRDAIVLRYFEQRNLRSIGEALGTSEDAAQKRVSRALDKLRTILAQQGVTLSLAALGSVLGTCAVSAAPAELRHHLGTKALRELTKRAGAIAALLAILTPSGLKLSLGAAAVIAAIAVLVWHRAGSTTPVTPEAAVSPLPSAAVTPSSNTADAAVSPPTALIASEAAGTEFDDPGTLRLTIVAADSGKPVPNIEVGMRCWEDRKFTGKKLFANREGICKVPFQHATTTLLELTTRMDDFADTRLEWRPDRGETIPADYTVRLIRPTRIGGQVVDADGAPVAGARVGFNHETDPLADKRPESHLFSWIEVTTDQDGRWTINRIADELLRRLYGSAKHSNYVNSGFIFVAQNSGAEQDLRDNRHVFRLGRPTTIRGVVLDPDSEPIPDAKILVGQVSESGRRSAISGADGTFSVAGCKPGRNLVTAEAEGFAAHTLEANVTSESAPLQITLERGKRLILRVVNRVGEPVPKASVYLDTFERGAPSARQSPPPQTELSSQADGAGRLVWSNAPDRELSFDLHAKGYMRLYHFKVRPDGEEHVATLRPALVVSGTVRDANGGQDIPKFRVICGWMEQGGGPQWSSIDRFWLNFTGGKFRHVFEEPVLISEPPRDFALKFEAEGYASFVSRAIRADEGESQFDVTLTKADDTSVTVLLPDGQPARAADVGLGSRNSQLTLLAGSFSRAIPNFSGLLQTDDQGKFHLPTDPTITRVFIAHKSGFGTSPPAALTKIPLLQLQPWGSIQGVFRTNGQPAVGQTLQLQWVNEEPNSMTLDRAVYKTVTDNQGQFAYPKVPSGRLTLVQLIPEKGPEPKTWSHYPLTDVEVQPNETARLTIGGEDRRFSLVLRWPENLKPGPDWKIYVSLQSLLRPIPGAADPAEAFERARRIPGATRTTILLQNPDDTWSASNVAPGDYTVEARVVRIGADQRPDLHALGRTSVSIASDGSSLPVELGEIPLRLSSTN
jgi:RNA polymerase sigma factor (sigma-70 family)